MSYVRTSTPETETTISLIKSEEAISNAGDSVLTILVAGVRLKTTVKMPSVTPLPV